MTKIKNLVMGLMFLLVIIPGAWADSVQINSVDQPVFWQPAAIENALNKMGASKEKSKEFLQLYYDETNNSGELKKISGLEVGDIWFRVFADTDENGNLLEQEYRNASDFVLTLIEEQNNLVYKLNSDVNQKPAANSDVLNADTAASIFESIMPDKCYTGLFSMLHAYTRNGSPTPEIINKQVWCVPVPGGPDNTFSCHYSHEYQGTGIACLVKCDGLEFTKSDSGYYIDAAGCSVRAVSPQSLHTN